ncbi:MAG TPA: coenzyme F420-0:L-glutamate ligase [Candidatus Saccharimonadales bacterium]|nr:coenzyme F420-0:L-glutamate ligase [Candidatus Saccharimonadales bacterium]
MIVTALKTRKVTAGALTLAALLDESLAAMPERGVLVISSKVVSLCENRVLPKAGTDLQKLVRGEAEWYMADAHEQHGYTFTIAHNMLTPNSGIDESNGDGQYVLWPADPQASANQVRKYLVERFGLREVAVIITDGSFLPLRWGATGCSLAFSGIEPVRSYKDKADLFGRPLVLTRTNVVDTLAAAATLVMGEGAEQTPLAVIEDVPDVRFVRRDPSAEEIAARHTPPEEDMFGQLLTSVEWRPGGHATGV